MDPDAHKIIDVLESRTQNYLIDYFSTYPLSERLKVNYVVMDMFKPYLSVIETYFSNAKIIIDTFHVVQHLNTALNRIRTEPMRNYRYSQPREYRKLKQLWKLV